MDREHGCHSSTNWDQTRDFRCCAFLRAVELNQARSRAFWQAYPLVVLVLYHIRRDMLSIVVPCRYKPSLNMFLFFFSFFLFFLRCAHWTPLLRPYFRWFDIPIISRSTRVAAMTQNAPCSPLRRKPAISCHLFQKKKTLVKNGIGCTNCKEGEMAAFRMKDRLVAISG